MKFLQISCKALDFTGQNRYNNLQCKATQLYRVVCFLMCGERKCGMAKNLAISYLLDFYGGVLTDKQREVMVQYYNDDLSLAEIAANFGITRQGVRDAIKRGEGTVLALEEKVGFAARHRATQDGMQRLEQLACDVRFINASSYAKSAEIEAAANEMLQIVQEISK